jgi:ABC-type transport system involved in multi-copper enzyme maturation permease subunit
MASKAITDKPTDDRLASGWKSSPDTGPSVVKEDEPTVARTVGMFGAAFVIFGSVALASNLYLGRPVRVGPGWASMALALGFLGLLYHAAFDRDVQFRRIYAGFGYALLALGAFCCLLPYPKGVGSQFGLGYPLLALVLPFQLIFLRHETDRTWRQGDQIVIGGVGVLLAVLGLGGGSIRAEFLEPYGLLFALLGLVYLSAFVISRGTGDDLGYRTGIGLGLVGLLVFLVALGRSALPPLFYAWKWTDTPPAGYAVPTGLVLMVLGLAYAVTATLLCSERPLVVVMRRELGAFFYSPIAYIMLLAFTVATWWAFFSFVNTLLSLRAQTIEPIVSNFILQWPPIFIIVCVVPAITMRLLSEERRSGTLEVLLTAPVEESAVVVGKFLAAFLMFLVVWLPFGLFMIALRIGGGEPFDYRPLLSFAVALAVTGASFVSMGLFFSSLTRNQIASFVLTFAGMLTLTVVFLVRRQFFPSEMRGETSNLWAVVLDHLSYVDLWIDTLDGKLVLKYLLFPFTITFLWLFLSVKVLEARKWAA